MANIYVRSTDGSNSDDGSTWTLAKLDLAGATAGDAAGDTIYVSQSHAESTASAITIASAGTATTPSRILCVNDGAEPPTTMANTATVTTTTGHLNITGSMLSRGVSYRAGSGQGGSLTYSVLIGSTAGSSIQFEDCALQVLTTGTGAATLQFGDDSRTDVCKVQMKNTSVMLSGTAQRIKVSCDFDWINGSFTAGAANPTSVFSTGTRGFGKFLVSGVNFNNIGTSFHLIAQPSSGNAMRLKFVNITLPTSWSGNLWSATPSSPWQRAEIFNSIIGTSTKIRVWVDDYAGNAKDNTTVYRTSGATDDGTNISIKMVSTANAEYPIIPFEGVPITKYVDSTSSTTFSLEIVHDSQGAGSGNALQNNQFGVRVIYPGGVTETVKADPLAAATDITSSSESWTTTGLTTPVKQKVSVTFTPTVKGEVTLIPILYAASKTVYICPKLGS